MVAIDMSEIEEWFEERKSGETSCPLDVVVGWNARAKARLTIDDEELDYGYSVSFPSAAADAPLENREPPMSFVDYLRLAFRWGGFPGWEGQTIVPDPEIRLRTAGLLPI